jgi:Skp family chaperone for outer membrane proteins
MRILSLLSLTLLSLSGFAQEKSNITNYAVFEYKKIVEETKLGKSIIDIYEKEKKEKQVEMQKMVMELQKKVEQLKKQQALLSEEGLLRKESELSYEEKKIMMREKSLKEEFLESQKKGYERIIQEIYRVVESISQEQGFHQVFEKETAPFYLKNKTDITDDIIMKMDKVYKK